MTFDQWIPQTQWMEGVVNTPVAYIICGLIWSLTLGFAAGNFACSLVYRLPRGKSILENKPYCGSCGHALATSDLFPVFSALILRHKCRYCAAAIPISHFWTEIVIGALFCLCYVQFNFSQEYLLIAGIGVFFVIMAAIEANDKVVMTSVLVTLSVLGMIFRTLQDGEIYNFFQGGLFALLLGAIVWRKGIKPVNHVFSLPMHARMVIPAGIILGANQLALEVVLLLALWLAGKVLNVITGGWLRVPFSVLLGLAVMGPLLFG